MGSDSGGMEARPKNEGSVQLKNNKNWDKEKNRYR